MTLLKVRNQAGHRQQSQVADHGRGIDDAAPLFGEGLGLDSIDVLELVLELERSFGVAIGDEQTGGKVLRSVDTIAEFVAQQRRRLTAGR